LVAPATQTLVTGPPTARASHATATDAGAAASHDGALHGVGTFAAATGSFVGYRVIEKLSSVVTNRAVCHTGDIAGKFVFDGSTITTVDIEVNVATLTNDGSRRDMQLRDLRLQTSKVPIAIFSLPTPIELSPVLPGGEPSTVVALGELMPYGTIRPGSVKLNGQLVDRFLAMVDSPERQVADFEILPPTGFIVLSVDKHSTLEFQFVFEWTS
jgi:hypothetical protein